MASTLPLHERFVDLGAAFGEVDGWVLPLRFGSVSEEVAAARGAAALLDLSSQGMILATGSGRAGFLQRMLSNEVVKLQPGSGCYAALLDHKGHLLSDLRVIAQEEAILLLTPPSAGRLVQEALERYIVADPVELRDVSAASALFAIQGPHAADVYFQLTGDMPAGDKHSHRAVTVQGLAVRLIHSNHTGDGGFDVLASRTDAEAVFDLLMAAGHDFGIRPIGLEAHNCLRVEAGIPWLGADMDNTNLVQEALLEEAVSYTKGCYIGQETVARLHARGHVNRHLCGFRLQGEEAPAAGDKVLVESKEMGWITSGVYSPSLREPIALGYLRRESARVGTQVTVSSGERAIKGKVASLPIYDPSV